MKRIAALFVLLLIAPLGFGQANQNNFPVGALQFTGAPPTNCSLQQLAVNTTTSVVYYCPAAGGSYTPIANNTFPEPATVSGNGTTATLTISSGTWPAAYQSGAAISVTGCPTSGFNVTAAISGGGAGGTTMTYLNATSGSGTGCTVNIANGSGGTISGVNAGTGLSGGGASGSVTLNLVLPVASANTASSLSGASIIPNGSTVTTQPTGDSSNLAASDGFVLANAAHFNIAGLSTDTNGNLANGIGPYYDATNAAVGLVEDGQVGQTTGSFTSGTNTFTTSSTPSIGQWINIEGAGLPATGTFSASNLTSVCYASGTNGTAIFNTNANANVTAQSGLPDAQIVSAAATWIFEANGPKGPGGSSTYPYAQPMVQSESPLFGTITGTITVTNGSPTITTTPASALASVASGTPVSIGGAASQPQSDQVFVTNGSATVTLVSGPVFGLSSTAATTWANVQVSIGGTIYTVSSVGSTTSLTLSSNFAGSTGTYPMFVNATYYTLNGSGALSTNFFGTNGTYPFVVAPSFNYTIPTGPCATANTSVLEISAPTSAPSAATGWVPYVEFGAAAEPQRQFQYLQGNFGSGVIKQTPGMAITSWTLNGSHHVTATYSMATSYGIQEGLSCGTACQNVLVIGAAAGVTNGTNINGYWPSTATTTSCLYPSQTCTVTFTIAGDSGADSGGAGGAVGPYYRVACTPSTSGYGCALGATAYLMVINSDGYLPPTTPNLQTVVTNFNAGTNTVTTRDNALSTAASGANLAYFTDNSALLNAFLLQTSPCNPNLASTSAMTKGCEIHFAPSSNYYFGLASSVIVDKPNVKFKMIGGQYGQNNSCTTMFGAAGRFSMLRIGQPSSNMQAWSGEDVCVQDVSDSGPGSGASPAGYFHGGNVPAGFDFINVQDVDLRGGYASWFASGMGFYAHGVEGYYDQISDFGPSLVCFGCAIGFHAPDNGLDNTITVGELYGMQGNQSTLNPKNPAQGPGSRIGIFIGNEIQTTGVRTDGWRILQSTIRSFPYDLVSYDSYFTQFHESKTEQAGSNNVKTGTAIVFDGMPFNNAYNPTANNCVQNSVSHGYLQGTVHGIVISTNCAYTQINSPQINNSETSSVQYVEDGGMDDQVTGIQPNGASPGNFSYWPSPAGLYLAKNGPANPNAPGDVVCPNATQTAKDCTTSQVNPIGVALASGAMVNLLQSNTPTASVAVQTSGVAYVNFDVTSAGDCNGTTCTTAVNDFYCTSANTVGLVQPQSTACAAGRQAGVAFKAVTTGTSGPMLIMVR